MKRTKKTQPPVFYSKTGQPHGRFRNVVAVSKIDPTSDDINFYWNLFDEFRNKISINNCIDEVHIELIKHKPDARLHIDFHHEIITTKDVEQIKNLVNEHGIPAEKITVYVQDQLQEQFILNKLAVRVEVYPRHYVTVEGHLDLSSKNLKKFSFLCRRHTDWRLRFAEQLSKNRILKNSHWSYLGIDPKNEQFYQKLVDAKQGFLRKIPHKLYSRDRGENQNLNVLYQAINSSLVHILIETVYDQTDYTRMNYYDRKQMPTDVSEKTFKAISLKKPFVVFGTPYWLEDFRSMGFKTFSPCINESYDLEEDNEKRMALIVQELRRLNQLDQKDLEQTVLNCKDSVEHNFNVWKNVYDQCREQGITGYE